MALTVQEQCTTCRTYQLIRRSVSFSFLRELLEEEIICRKAMDLGEKKSCLLVYFHYFSSHSPALVLFSPFFREQTSLMSQFFGLYVPHTP